jgi:serine/threonine-protein kinase
VLDFGLAKSAGQLSPLEVSARPTALGDATQAGTVLGTAAYMAPEQAQGKPVDKRADIWAFGVVLSEMLTGQSPFRCETLAETLAAVLTKEPDWSRVPARVQPLLRRCLAKNPRERLRDIGDVPLLLNGVEPATRQSSMVARAAPWVIAAAVSVVALAATFWMSRVGGGGSNDESVMRWTLNMDIANPGNGFGISRDGRRVAYPAAGDARQRIGIRRSRSPARKAGSVHSSRRMDNGLRSSPARLVWAISIKYQSPEAVSIRVAPSRCCARTRICTGLRGQTTIRSSSPGRRA